jgi:outer membrane lipoprotein-sorting protein
MTWQPRFICPAGDLPGCTYLYFDRYAGGIIMMRRTVLTLVPALITCVAPGSGHCYDKKLLEEARDGNRSALESIHSFSCSVSITSDKPPVRPLPFGEYWRGFDGSIRLKTKLAEQTVDQVQAQDKVKSITQANGKTQGAIVAAGQMLGPCDVWYHGLCTLPGPQFRPLTLDELLAAQVEVKTCKRVQEVDVSLIYLELRHASGRLEVWLDPSANYMVRRTILKGRIDGKDLPPHEKKVIRFTEVRPTLYFPAEVAAQDQRDDGPSPISVYHFADVRIDAKIDDTKFRLVFPAGITVIDTVQGKAYRSRDGGKLEESNDITLTTEQPNPVDGETPRLSVTTEEPKSFTRWILPSAVAVLVISGGMLLYRRYRRPTV